MTKTAEPTEGLVNTIKRDLESTTTTTSQTLNLLRAVLGIEQEKEKAKINPIQPKVPARRKPVATKDPPKGARNVRQKDGAVFDIFESKECKVSPVQGNSRRKLATETFNSTLKTLNLAAKTKQATGESQGAKQPQQPHLNGVKPLHESSPNRQRKLDRNEPPKQIQEDIGITADCAVVALDCLRDIHNKENENAEDLNLEKGGLILLDKTITLRLTEQAIYQLKRVHEQYWKSRSYGLQNQTSKPKVGSIAPFLCGCPNTDKPVFTYTTSFQSQALRLAVLLGHDCVDQDFLSAVQPETDGSPVWMINHGLRSGHLDQETSGLQLRTIALALSKIYSVSIESTSPAKPEVLFGLLHAALRIKCESWKQLGHQADLERECWSHFYRGVKRFCQSQKRDDKSIKISCKYAETLQGTLKSLGYDETIPSELAQYLSMGNEKPSTCNGKSTKSQTSVKHPGTQELIEYCKKATDSLIQFPKDMDGALRIGEETLDSFRIHLKGTRSQFEDLLLYGAQMRKSASNVIPLVEKSITKVEKADQHSRLQICALRLMNSFIDFLLRYFKSEEFSADGDHKTRHRALLTTAAKSIEAVFGAQKCSIARSLDFVQEGGIAIRRCLELSDLAISSIKPDTGEDAVVKYLKTLPVRASQLFWSQYLNSVEKRYPESYRIETLELSIAVVETRTLDEQKTAFLSLKYEKLASCLEDMDKPEGAISMLKSAIKSEIKQGTLSDAVELALSNSLESVWNDRDSKTFAFGRNLGRLVKLLHPLNTSNKIGLLIYDDATLQPIHRAIMIERQLQMLAEYNLNTQQKRAFVELIKLVLGLCNEQQYRLYRSRFLSYILAWSARKQICSSDDCLGFEKLQNLYNEKKSTSKVLFLEQFEPILSVVVPVQLAFCSGVIEQEFLHKSIDKLCGIATSCTSSDDVCLRIHDRDIYLAQLRILGDYAAVLGLSKLRLNSLQSVQHVLELDGSSRVTDVINCLIEIGTLRNQFQDTISAGKAFARIEKLLTQVKDDNLTFVEWSIAYAEYLLNISNLTKCLEVLSLAKESFEDALEPNTPISVRYRIRRDNLLCRAELLASKIAFHQGLLPEATLQARRSVKLSTSIWTLVEKSLASAALDENDSSLNSLTEGLANLSLTSSPGNSQSTLNGARFWSQISLHSSILNHMAFISAHHGLYQDAIHYYEQACKISSATSCSTILRSELALLYARGGETSKAMKLISKQTEVWSPLHPYTNQSIYAINHAETYLLLGDIETCQSFLQMAKSCIESGQQSLVVALPTKTASTAPKTSNVKAASNLRKKPAFAKPKPGAKQVQSKVIANIETPKVYPTLEEESVQDKLSVLEDNIILSQNDDTRTFDTRVTSPDLTSQSWTSRKYLAKALLMIRAALEVYSTDAVKGVLAETAIALPVRYKTTAKHDRVSFIQSGSPRKRVEPKLVRKNSTELNLSNGDQLLIGAHQLLCLLKEGRNNRSSSDILHLAYKTLSQLALLSTGTAKPFSYSSLQLVLQSLIPKDQARRREQLTIMAEQESSSREQVEQWPDIELQKDSIRKHDHEYELSHLTEILPKSWTIISISLGQEQNELLISKSMAGRSPFLMRVPLSRQDGESDECEEFSFDAAKSELLDIIQNANATAHDSRGQGDKQTRKAWYADRESLDQRLEALVTNLENIWLGGFRGLLSSESSDEALLSRFGQSLSQSLDKHLPSRQKSSKAIFSKVELHAHVLELFTSLQIAGETEMEDSVTDLLYFVVDVLQFNGEQNAYDEIDFDAILVDVLDALNHYHEANKANAQQTSRHTILVLDKELQSFPWESMPCLKDCSVSRMPSLGAIKERLDMIRAQSENSQCYSVPYNSGAYMLNPSSDLTSTQETFSAVFEDQLQDFSAIVNHVPTEKEFETCLQENSLFIYMGHGSGAQYIRGRTIRKMNNCAVTLLMGCSSAKMTECGVYESYGMPWHYMNAGSPALLGTLWDVTDRDIDRFAMTMLCEWGLIEEATNSEKSTLKSKGKGKAKSKSPSGSEAETVSASHRRGIVALDEAVSKARDSCALRYLNGAAPVIYGIPVLLE